MIRGFLRCSVSLCVIVILAFSVAADEPSPPSTNSLTNEPWAGEYLYDGAGNIKAIGPNHYVYDGVRRLVEGTAVTSVQDSVRRYSYDAFGNLLKIQTGNDATIIAVNPSTNRMDGDCEAGGPCFTANFDEQGHQTTGEGSAQYDYDAVDMMTTLDVALEPGSRHEVYIYDAEDQRIATVVDATTSAPTWHYTLRDAGANVIREWTAAGPAGAASWSWTKDYVHRDGVLLASIANAGGGVEQRTHFHLDHLNTPRLITDDEARKVAVHTYWPFGVEADGSDIDDEARKYTGHERDRAGSNPDADLDYMHARYYSSASGRFLSVDPVLKSADRGIPQRWNRYAYTANNPVNRVDPDGRLDEQPFQLDPEVYKAQRIRLKQTPGSVKQDDLFLRMMGKVILTGVSIAALPVRVAIGTAAVGAGVGALSAKKGSSPGTVGLNAVDGAASGLIVRGLKNAASAIGLLPKDSNARDDGISGLSGLIGGSLMKGNAITDFVTFNPNSMPGGPPQSAAEKNIPWTRLPPDTPPPPK